MLYSAYTKQTNKMIRKFRKKVFLACCLFSTLFIVILFMFTSDSKTRLLDISRIKVTYPNEHFQQKSVKKILKWTQFFHDGSLKGDKECLKTCAYKCEITDVKEEIQDADAVVFHLLNLWPKNWSIGTKVTINFPNYRRTDQRWVVMNMEPPPHLFGDLKVFNGLFNWTSWYRQDADVMMPYGTKHKLTATEQRDALEMYKNRNYYQEKTKQAALMISNCFDPGQRYRVIEVLDKYLDLDKFGKCYKNTCGHSRDPTDQSCQNSLKKYRFYIAFENDDCIDYVTEKYWLPLKRDQIPIVNWKNVDQNLVIPHTYINIYDFESLEKAATYIKTVNNNETLFNSYFDYRSEYSDHSRCVTCKLCEALHDKTRPAQIYKDFDAWVRNDTCEKVGIWNNIMKNVYGRLFYTFGI